MSRFTVQKWSAILLLAALLLVGGCTRIDNPDSPAAGRPSSSSAAAAEEFSQHERDVAQISAMLRRRAAAVRAADRKAFLRLTDRSDRSFAAQQRTLFSNLVALHVRSFSYRPVENRFNRHPFISERMTAEVIEDVRLRGPDLAPVSNTLEMGFRKHEGRWVVSTHRGQRPEPDDIQSRPWGGGPIAVTRRGTLVVVVDRGDADEGPSLADAVEREVPQVAATIGAKPRFNLLVDATSTGRRSRIGGKKVIADAVAFTVYTYDTTGERETRIAGQRIKFDPRQPMQLLDNAGLLRHELTHFLTKGSQAAPQWVEEGLAEYVRYHPTRPSGLVLPGDLHDRVLAKSPALPTTRRFGVDPDSDYLIAQSAATYLIDTFGMVDFNRFRLAFTFEPGQPDRQTRRHLRRVFDISAAELVAGTWNKFGEFHRG